MKQRHIKKDEIFRIYQATGINYLRFLIPTVITICLLSSYIYIGQGIKKDFFTTFLISTLLLFGYGTYKTLVCPQPLIWGTKHGLWLNIVPFNKGYFVPWVDLYSAESDQIVHRYSKYDLLAKSSPPLKILGTMQDDRLLKIQLALNSMSGLPIFRKNVIMCDKETLWFRVAGDIINHVNEIKRYRDLAR